MSKINYQPIAQGLIIKCLYKGGKTMENQLIITADLEDYTAGLTGKLSVDGFCGFGEGWFNTSEIREFCQSLSQLALNLTGSAELIAGQSKSDGSEYLERFGIRCYVISKTGVIGLHVSLSHCPYYDCRNEQVLKISGEIMAEVQPVLDFCNQLQSLCTGSVSEVILKAR